jgi:hemoglobin
MARTLWDRLGGEDNVKKVVAEFVANAVKDPKVDFFRGGRSPLDTAGVTRLQKLLVEQISQAAGGPLKYSGKSMKEVHRGMGITDAQFDALAGHLKNALEKNGARPEDIKAVLDAVGMTRKDIVEKDGGE